VPADWSAPLTDGSAAGYSTSDCGTVAVSGSTLQVTGVTLSGGDTCTIVYGSKASGGPGASAPPSDAIDAFAANEMSTATGILTALASSPSVTTSTFPTLTVTVSGSGSITGTGISCPGTCSHNYAPGTSVTLSAAPAAGFELSAWGGACTGTGACDVTMSSAQTVTATFTAKPPAPTCQPVQVSTNEGTSVSIHLQCTDAANAALTYAVNSGVAHGSLGTIDQATADVSYEPASGFSGSDSFTYHASSTNGTASAVKVTITVKASALATKCVVPKLKGDSLSEAKSLLAKAHCSVGKIMKPKVKKGHKAPKLVVGSTSPGAGSRLEKNAKVAIKLVAAPKRKQHRS
jgi:hypothetical protein